MILGIDASNIRSGGGVTHLVELLRAAVPGDHGIDSVRIWGWVETLEKIDDREWMQKVSEPLVARQLPYRIFWQLVRLRRIAARAGCDLLFVPGGSAASGFEPMVTMSQNLLPFEWREMRRYGWSLSTLKFLLLRIIQGRSFRNADGVIFLTKYARESVLKVVGTLRAATAIIPHGVNPRFIVLPRPQRLPTEFTENQPCRVLYVSIVDMYKHQWHVAEAVAQLRSIGVPVVLELVGPPARGMGRLQETLNRIDPAGTFIVYRGVVPYEELHSIYAAADIGVFASSCENMPNILVEGMAAGLPMACSRKSPMPEVLGDAGIYFDPENPHDIARALQQLIGSADLRARLAKAAFDRAKKYSWQRCADETFGFLAGIARVRNETGERNV
jgi:glycosyltransferase involved in cell wall biosynthesis